VKKIANLGDEKPMRKKIKILKQELGCYYIIRDKRLLAGFAG